MSMGVPNYAAGATGNTTVNVPGGYRLGLVSVVGGTFTISPSGPSGTTGGTGATITAPATPGFTRDFGPAGVFGPLNVVLGAGVASYFIDWFQ